MYCFKRDIWLCTITST